MTNSSSTEPIWGSKTIEPITFNNEDEFEIFLNAVRQANRELYEKYLLSNVNTFLHFVRCFKQSGTVIKAEEYFNNQYRILFNANIPVKDYASQSLVFLENFREKYEAIYPTISKSMYLSATSFDASKEDIEAAKVQSISASEPIFAQNINHCTATIKFKLNEKVGYVFVEPRLPKPTPLVVMENREDINHFLTGVVRLTKNQFDNAFFATLEGNPNYIVTEPFGNEPLSVNILIFAARQYCSFVDTTFKNAILERYKYLVRRDARGNKAGLEFLFWKEEGDTGYTHPWPAFKLSLRLLQFNKMITHDFSFEEPLHPKKIKDDLISYVDLIDEILRTKDPLRDIIKELSNILVKRDTTDKSIFGIFDNIMRAICLKVGDTVVKSLL